MRLIEYYRCRNGFDSLRLFERRVIKDSPRVEKMQGQRSVNRDEYSRTVMPVLPELRRYARTLTRNREDAEDLLQDTLLRAYNKFHLWQPGTNIAGWLSVVMKRVFLSQIKRRQYVTTPLEDFDRPLAASQEDCLDISRLGVAIDGLAVRHRQLVEAIAIDGDSYEDVAEALNIPIGTVRSRLGRARKYLRRGTGIAYSGL